MRFSDAVLRVGFLTPSGRVRKIRLRVRVFSRFSDAVFGCGFRMRFSDAVFGCGFRMRFSDAVFGCGFRMRFSDAVFGCGFRMRFSDAVLRVGFLTPSGRVRKVFSRWGSGRGVCFGFGKWKFLGGPQDIFFGTRNSKQLKPESSAVLASARVI
jgi:hypothetical protein